MQHKQQLVAPSFVCPAIAYMMANTRRYLPPYMMATSRGYVPPRFLEKVARLAPLYRLELAMRPTPINLWNLHAAIPDLPQDITIHIKRDDMTGSTTSGNKIRKLEFLFADALEKQCDTIITAGGVQSNHVRTTVVAAKELGMSSHVFLRTPDYDKPHLIDPVGNVLINKLVGAEMHLIPRVSYLAGILPKMKELSTRLQEEGRKPYLIGIGGSNELGLWGYIEGYAEIMEQGGRERFTDIVVPIGSGGTASGLAIGNYLAGLPLHIHAVTVCDTPAYFYGHLDEMLASLELNQETSARDILNIIDGKGKGYARSTDEELELGVRVSSTTGILLDPVYTLKALYGMVKDLKGPNSVFKPDAKILFIHTGGIFSLYDGRVEPFVDQSRTTTWVNRD